MFLIKFINWQYSIKVYALVLTPKYKAFKTDMTTKHYTCITIVILFQSHKDVQTVNFSFFLLAFLLIKKLYVWSLATFITVLLIFLGIWNCNIVHPCVNLDTSWYKAINLYPRSLCINTNVFQHGQCLFTAVAVVTRD